MGFGIKQMRRMVENDGACFEWAPEPLRYKIKKRLITEPLLSKYVESRLDEGTKEFLREYCKAEDGCTSFLTNCFRYALSVTDTNAILRRGQMHVLSEQQLEALLEGIAQPNFNNQTQNIHNNDNHNNNNNNGGNNDNDDNDDDQIRIFDIGAGDGTVTKVVAKVLCSNLPQKRRRERGGGGGGGGEEYKKRVLTSEMSTWMHRRLKELGFGCVASIDTTRASLEKEIRENHKAMNEGRKEDDPLFHYVCCLNVLDRCDTPITLLENIRKLLITKNHREENEIERFGYLILAVVLPWSAFVESGSKQLKPKECLPETGPDVIWRSSSYLHHSNTPTSSTRDRKSNKARSNNKNNNKNNKNRKVIRDDDDDDDDDDNNENGGDIENVKVSGETNQNITKRRNNNSNNNNNNINEVSNMNEIIQNDNNDNDNDGDDENNYMENIKSSNHNVNNNNNNNNNNRFGINENEDEEVNSEEEEQIEFEENFKLLQQIYDSKLKKMKSKKKKEGVRCACCCTFEESVEWLVANVIEKCGYEVMRWTRVPYISAGDIHCPYYALNNAVFVLKPSFLMGADVDDLM